ncbi:acetyl-CoA C-acyltransferase [Burkholderia sp. IMCC1007]|uniref:acetyl-CoA C-acyltransferase n=1 Tax=Burkholderia sp. IMCC1007 TaxID=3004104 RepID=UPI0022B5B1A0|nr:acetyl-CoA C-acyltransferase [Burkholderia sp. IMCC1007]
MTRFSRNAWIVGYARTPIGRAFRGAFNDTTAPTLAAFSLRGAVARSGIDPERIDDVILGCALPEGTQYYTIGRLAALAAGLPVTTPGMTVDRQCSSGLMSIALASARIAGGDAGAILAGGVESISLVQAHMNRHRQQDERLLEQHPDAYMPMVDTADIVASRYGVSRRAQDDYAVISQQRAAHAAQTGLLHDEIVAVDVLKLEHDKATGTSSPRALRVTADECGRPGTTIDALSALDAVRDGGTVTAGNACALADGSAACAVVSDSMLDTLSTPPLGRMVACTVAGCRPDEMGVGPVPAVRRLLERTGLSVADVGLWELNEAFASQVVHCVGALGLSYETVNVNGGSIALGHPYGMTGTRMVGHALLEGARRGVKYVVVTMCIGGGQGAAALFEVDYR